MQQGSTGGVLCCLLALVLSVDICQGKITSFSVSLVRGESSRCFRVNTDVALVCDVDDGSSTIAIKRLQDGALVNRSRVGEMSLNHVIYDVSCSDMGTYECILDHTERRTADLVIAKCPLQACHGAEVQTTVFVDVGHPVQFSACVLACVGIAPFAAFNDTLVNKNSLSDWTWNYVLIASTGLSTSRFNVHVSRDRLGTAEYGTLRVRIFNSLGKVYFVDFYIRLKPPGPPHCPTDITVTNYGHDYVILSWKPGLDGGSRQYFYIYYSKDKATWVTDGSKTENTTEHVSGLSSHTSYYFRVASGNQHSTSVDASTCTRTVFVTTKSLNNIGDLFDNHIHCGILVLELGLCWLLVIMLLLAFFCLRRRKVNREHTRDVTQEHAEIPMVATQTGSNTSPGEYATVDDLGYSLPSSQ